MPEYIGKKKFELTLIINKLRRLSVVYLPLVAETANDDKLPLIIPKGEL